MLTIIMLLLPNRTDRLLLFSLFLSPHIAESRVKCQLMST